MAVNCGAVLLEARPFRPFKSSEEYLYAMKEDLAEWLMVLYPELMITADNFLDRLDTGVVLCRHANAVRESARILLETQSDESDEAVTLAKTLRRRAPVNLLPAARPGTFFARDNLSNFIDWCRNALGVLECLLFETDDLCLRKNEKHVVLCLLEVARRGAVLGMPAPLLVQMEKQIERELAGDDIMSDSQLGLVPIGPQPQLVTNDLRSLDERVRDLVARCSCPTQFPMVRVSEGKYRIGDTKILIFVRILRSHVMVRVGGGWDTLAHYLDKHDPCRCKAQHRTTLAARLNNRTTKPYADLTGATVTYERAEYPPETFKETPQFRTNEEVYKTNSIPFRDDAPMSLPYFSEFTRNSPPRTSEAPARLSPPNFGTARKSSSPDRRCSKPGLVASNHLVPIPHAKRAKSPRATSPSIGLTSFNGNNAENGSDNGSEVSDEGYRSLGLVCSPPHGKIGAQRNSMHSQNSVDDADFSERLEPDDGCIEKSPEKIDEHVSLNTGLRKTDYSDTFYGKKKSEDYKRMRSTPERSVSHESNDSPSKSLRARSASKIPHSPVRQRTPIRTNTPSPTNGPSKTSTPKTSPSRLPPSSRNTWSGRTGPTQMRSRSRPTFKTDTYDSPSKSPKSRASQSPTPESFKRNSSFRASSNSLRSNSSKQISPLLEQILKSAETAKDDAAVLEKMKDIIRQYSKGDRESLSRGSSKESDYSDFTSAWVMSDGKLERSASTRQLAAPRRDPRTGSSKIPAPVSFKRSTSTSNFE